MIHIIGFVLLHFYIKKSHEIVFDMKILIQILRDILLFRSRFWQKVDT